LSKGNRVSLNILVYAVALASMPLVGFTNEPPTSLDAGIFSKDQAKAGKRLYKQHCKSCHEGSYFKPVLLAWRGEPLSTFFELMTSAMPENDPGSLKHDQYTDILAHILNISGYTRGEKPLNSTTFSAITIDKPASK
jgi:mono/diheme cytochrome c family protein